MSTQRLRLAFFGTPDFALPTLERLIAGPHEVALVVSQPDRPRGRGLRSTKTPVAALALRCGLPLLLPEQVGCKTEGGAGDAAPQSEAGELSELWTGAPPDLGVVVAFGCFLPKRVRHHPTLGYCINAHASLLPKHRGAAPVAHALLAGDAQTGISVMRVEREMDAGPVALARRIEIEANEDAGALTARLAALAADAVAEAVDNIAAGCVRWREQDHAGATFAPKLTPGDARLDFTQSAEHLARRVRALSPRPGAFTTLQGARLRVLAATALAEERPAHIQPGEIECAGCNLRIACGEGWLAPLRLQRAGGKALDTAAFLRGHALQSGLRLGVESHDGGDAKRDAVGTDPADSDGAGGTNPADSDGAAKGFAAANRNAGPGPGNDQSGNGNGQSGSGGVKP